MAKNFIISGSGGQGVISIGAILASIFMFAGKFVSFSSCYGAEMRGGAVNCEINMDDNEIYSVFNGSADVVVALNEISFEKFITKVKQNGVIIVNSSLAKIKKTRDDIKYIFAPLTQEALKLGSIKFTNSVALGVLARVMGSFSIEAVTNSYKKILKNKEDLIQKNIEAYLAGYNFNLEVVNAG